MTATVTGITRRQDWRAIAACRNADPDLFVGPDEESLRDRLARVKQATAVCAACPVREICLSFALRTGERDGIYGGLTEYQRRGQAEISDTADVLCRSKKHVKTTPGRCLPCKREGEHGRRPAAGLGSGSNIAGRERDKNGRLIKAAGNADSQCAA